MPRKNSRVGPSHQKPPSKIRKQEGKKHGRNVQLPREVSKKRRVVGQQGDVKGKKLSERTVREGGGIQGRNARVSRYKFARFVMRVIAFFCGERSSKVTSSGLERALKERVHNIEEKRDEIEAVGSLDLKGVDADAIEKAQDNDLIADFKKKGKLGSNDSINKKPIEGELFSKGEPSFLDITQGDKRSDCYFLGTLAGVLAREDGPENIAEMMKDNGDGTVTVKFGTEAKPVFITVDKTRLTTEAGKDLYSVGKSWVGILEKAFQAYLIHEEGQGLDQGNPETAYKAFGHILFPKNLEGNNYEYVRLMDAGGADRLNEILDSNSHVVTFSTQSRAAEHHPLHWVTHRFMPGHTYAVLGRANEGNRGGYIIFDPYNFSVGATGIEEQGSEIVIKSKRGSSGLFFVSEKELFNYSGGIVASKTEVFGGRGDAGGDDEEDW